jgi:hypothetical protein
VIRAGEGRQNSIQFACLRFTVAPWHATQLDRIYRSEPLDCTLEQNTFESLHFGRQSTSVARAIG